MMAAAAAINEKTESRNNSKSTLKGMQHQVHGDSVDDSDDCDSEGEMGAESDEFDGSDQESSDVMAEDGVDKESVEDEADESVGDEEDAEDDEEDEDGKTSDEEMDSLSGDAEGGDWMEVDDDDSESNRSSSDESDDDVQVEKSKEIGNGDPKLHGNAGWADAMAKILRASKPKGKKSIVLAKAKKLSQVVALGKTEEKKEDYGFEIDGKSSEETDLKPKVEDIDIKPNVTDSKFKVKRRDLLKEAKVKPSILSRERERALNKIATKGVVQLFNAVRDQQKDISKKVKLAGGSIRKEDKIIKSVDKQSFLDSLMGNARSERVEDHIHTKPEEDPKMEKSENPATWNVLRDNFLTGSNMKDWDKCGEIKLEDDIDEVELN